MWFCLEIEGSVFTAWHGPLAAATAPAAAFLGDIFWQCNQRSWKIPSTLRLSPLGFGLSSLHPDIFALKHVSRILGHCNDPALSHFLASTGARNRWRCLSHKPDKKAVQCRVVAMCENSTDVLWSEDICLFFHSLYANNLSPPRWCRQCA